MFHFMFNFLFNLNIDIINCTANIHLPILTVCLTLVKYDWCVLHSSYIRHLNYYSTSYNALLYSTIFYSTLGRQDCVLPRSVQRLSEHRTISAVKRRQHKHHRQGTILHYKKLYCYLSLIKDSHFFNWFCCPLFLSLVYFLFMYLTLFIWSLLYSISSN